MTVEQELAGKQGLIRHIASSFISRTPWIEFDDAVQVVSLTAWRILSRPERQPADDVNGAIIHLGYRRLIDEVRTGRTGGLKRTWLHRPGMRVPVSLNEEVRDLLNETDGLERIDLIQDPTDPFEDINDDVTPTLDAALQQLPERERLVVWLRYYEDLTQREIGGMLGISESRVSQLLKRAIARLTPQLAAAA